MSEFGKQLYGISRKHSIETKLQKQWCKIKWNQNIEKILMAK